MATEKVINIVINKKGADKSVKELKENVKGVDQSTSKLTGTLDKMSGGAVSAFGAMKAGIGTAVRGFKSLRVAIIGTGIGALIIAILAVKEAFTSSEEGQNKFAKIMGVIGSITGNLSDLLSNLGMKIISVFENPKQAIKDFVKLIKENVINRFEGLLNLIPSLAKAVNQLFKGDFSGAAVTAGNAVAKVTLGLDNLSESVKKSAEELKKFAKEVAEEANIAAGIADKRAKADKLDRDLIVERAKANRDIADLRFKAEQRDKFSAKERIEFLKNASSIQESITNKEIESAQLRLDARVAENKLANSTKDDLAAEEQLKARLIQLETQRLNLNKRLETQIQSAQNEVKAKAKADAKLKQDKIDKDKKEAQEKLDTEEKERIAKIEKEAKNEEDRLQKIADIQDEFKKRREDEAAETELQKLELEKERKLKELEELEANEQQKSDIIKFYDDKINAQKKTDQQIKDDEALRDLQTVEDLKIEIKNKAFGLLMALGGKAEKIGKALATADVIREQVKSVSNVIASTTEANAKAVAASPITGGQPFVGINTLKAVSSVVGSATAVARAISQIKSGSGGGSTGGFPGGGGGGETSAPSFNLVQGTPQNQLAESLGGVANRPVETYVVASNVTTAQSLNRNKLDEGSI
jgi:hypothetical protein